MQIRKFLGDSLKEAINRMKIELGDEAVVLSTKVQEMGEGLSKKKMFEITAGVEDDFDQSVGVAEQKETVKGKPANNFESELKKLTDKIYGNQQINDERKSADGVNSRFVDSLKEEINEIKNLLLQREVDESIAETIVGQLNKNFAFLTNENLESYVLSTIGSMVPTETFEVKKKTGPMVISLVGPTGVGKTTCIAKLAVISKILHTLDIGLISIDTYRLGALDQLKIFSEVSNIDFLVAYDPSDLKKHLNKFKKKDIIFIDTVGRSQKNIALLNDIKKFLDVAKSDEIYLVMSTTSTSKHMIDVAEKFKVLGYNAIVFTKLDEAVAFGNILNLVARVASPIKYLTNGQVIPDDIIAADPEFIANLIYTGKVVK